MFFDSISTGEALMFRGQRNYNYYDGFTPEMMQSYFVPRATEMVVHTPRGAKFIAFGGKRTCK